MESNQVHFLDLKKQYHSIRKEIDEAIESVIESSSFIGGKFVSQFENEFASYTGASFCVGVGNGTDALEIAIEGLDLPAGSEIIVPAMSFIASSEAITRQGHVVRFADIEEDTCVVSPKTVQAVLTENTSAIIAVHLYGNPCDMQGLTEVADGKIKLIEDCAQAHGATIRGKKVGAWSDVSCFSFYPGKILGAYGDAGAILCDDPHLAKRTRMIANHGRAEKYDHQFEGRNSRLDGLQAAILSVKLRYLDAWLMQRRKIANIYDEFLAAFPQLKSQATKPDAEHAYHLYVVRCSRRDQLKNFLKDRGVQCGVHYPMSLPQLQAYADHPQAKDDMVATSMGQEVLSLPIGEHMTQQDARTVCKVIEEFYNRNMP